MELKHHQELNMIFQDILLIVPYGIETQLKAISESSLKLLIVPYGIETRFLEINIKIPTAFNRTLWN